MEVEIYHKGFDLLCEIEYSEPTFEEEEQGLDGNFTVESIKLEDSEINIIELFDLDIIKELIGEKINE